MCNEVMLLLKGCHCFMLLDEFDRTKQVFPDIMHVLQNVIVEFYSLFIGLADTVKLRNRKTTRTFW